MIERMFLRRLLCLLALYIPATALQLVAEEWPMFGRNPEHSSYNAQESTLSKNNIRTLKPAWKSPTGGPLASSVTLSDGVLYFGGWNGYFYAMSAKDGSILWQQYVGKAAPPEQDDCQQPIGVTAQAAVADDVVYVGGGDSAVYALDRATGAQRWHISLADPVTGSYLWSSITRVDKILYIGIASLGDCPLVRGALVRIDVTDPTNPLIRYLAPEDEQGAGIWSTPAIDLASNTVYATTGTGEQDEERGMWGGTLVSLNATTLEVKQHFFLPTNSLEEDIEWGSSPTLVKLSDGTLVVVATGKDGVLYALDKDLRLLWQTKIAVQCVCPECGCGSLSTPAFDGASIFAGAGVSDPELFEEGAVYRINPKDGRVVWRTPTAGVIIAAVTVANGLVMAGTTMGLNVFDAETGRLLWKEPDSNLIYSQPVVAGGVIYCTYMNGNVTAFSIP
jgi:polyvinyl alcohol dehydrogenase (cytochrome)